MDVGSSIVFSSTPLARTLRRSSSTPDLLTESASSMTDTVRHTHAHTMAAAPPASPSVTRRQQEAITPTRKTHIADSAATTPSLRTPAASTPDPTALMDTGAHTHTHTRSKHKTRAIITKSSMKVVRRMDDLSTEATSVSIPAPVAGRGFHRRGRVLCESTQLHAGASNAAAVSAAMTPTAPCMPARPQPPSRRPRIAGTGVENSIVASVATPPKHTPSASPAISAGTRADEAVTAAVHGPGTRTGRVVRTRDLLTKFGAIVGQDSTLPRSIGTDYSVKGATSTADELGETRSPGDAGHALSPLTGREHFIETVFAAVREGNFSPATEAIESGKLEANVKDCLGETLLMVAAQLAARKFALFLMSRHADLDATDMMGNTALHYSCLHGDRTLMLQLVQRGANDKLRNNKGKVCYDFMIA